jgi:hypothetical protein
VERGVDRIKLYPVGGKKDSLLIKLTLPDRIRLEALWDAGYGAGNTLLIALNIGSLGYFYWYLPAQLERYADAVVDLENRAQVRMVRPSPILPDISRRQVLDDARLADVMLCFAVMLSLGKKDDKKYSSMFNDYLVGLRLIAHTDVHLDVAGQAFGEFYLAFITALQLFDPPADDEPITNKFMSALLLSTPDFDEGPRFAALGEEYRSTVKGPAGVTLDSVVKLKILLDVFLIKTFRRLEKDLLKRNPSRGDD